MLGRAPTTATCTAPHAAGQQSVNIVQPGADGIRLAARPRLQRIDPGRQQVDQVARLVIGGPCCSASSSTWFGQSRHPAPPGRPHCRAWSIRSCASAIARRLRERTRHDGRIAGGVAGRRHARADRRGLQAARLSRPSHRQQCVVHRQHVGRLVGQQQPLARRPDQAVLTAVEVGRVQDACHPPDTRLSINSAPSTPCSASTPVPAAPVEVPAPQPCTPPRARCQAPQLFTRQQRCSSLLGCVHRRRRGQLGSLLRASRVGLSSPAGAAQRHARPIVRPETLAPAATRSRACQQPSARCSHPTGRPPGLPPPPAACPPRTAPAPR